MITYCLLGAADEYGAMGEWRSAGGTAETRQTDLCQCHFMYHKTDVMSHGAEIKALCEKPARVSELKQSNKYTDYSPNFTC